MEHGLLPSPRIRFGPDYLRRVGGLVGRLAGVTERREGRGHSALYGSGEEFVGYRPYRQGESLAALDWNLLARLDQPFVRVSKREASESWAILLDTSASMGVGVPGKLQIAAEVAAGLCAVGLRGSATITLWSSSTSGGMQAERMRVERTSGVSSAMQWLESKQAEGESGLEALLAKARLAGSGRVFLIGDFFDVDPASIARIQRRGRELVFLRILSDDELVPAQTESVEWVDPESGQRRRMRVDREAQADYELELSHNLEAWRAFAARHRIASGCWSSTTAFEDIVGSILAPA